MSKANELLEKHEDELEEFLQESRAKLFNLENNQQQNKKAEKPHLFKETRRQIARLLTVINQKKQVKVQEEG